jgi:hypothetical protein
MAKVRDSRDVLAGADRRCDSSVPGGKRGQEPLTKASDGRQSLISPPTPLKDLSRAMTVEAILHQKLSGLG